MTVWNCAYHGPIQQLRESLRIDRSKLVKSAPRARGRRALVARIAWQERELEILRWKRHVEESLKNRDKP